MYLFTLALVNDIKDCLKGVQISAKAKDHRIALMHFSKFFQYHSDARQLKEFSNRWKNFNKYQSVLFRVSD